MPIHLSLHCLGEGFWEGFFDADNGLVPAGPSCLPAMNGGNEDLSSGDHLKYVSPL